MAFGNLQVGFSSIAFLGRFRTQNLYQPKKIPSSFAAEFYRVHALADKVQAQAARPDIFERAPAHLLRICRHTAIFQNYFESIFGPAIFLHRNPAEGGLDGPFRISEVSVANNIGKRFVNGQNHGTAFRLGKAQLHSELEQGISHHAEQLRIAAQLHFEE
jgi:hypothetical protein